MYNATSQRSPLNSYHTFLKELLQRAFLTHLTNDISGHSWIRVYKEDSVVLIILLGCQQVNTFHNVILLSVVQWSGKSLQSIIVFLLSEAVNECENWNRGVLISIYNTFNSRFTIVEVIARMGRCSNHIAKSLGILSFFTCPLNPVMLFQYTFLYIPYIYSAV